MVTVKVIIGAGIFAAKKDPSRFLWPGVMMAGALLLGAFLIVLIDKWRKLYASRSARSSSDELAEYRELYEAGELTKEEFDRLRLQLGGRILNESQQQSEPEQRPDSEGSEKPEPPSTPPDKPD